MTDWDTGCGQDSAKNLDKSRFTGFDGAVSTAGHPVAGFSPSALTAVLECMWYGRLAKQYHELPAMALVIGNTRRVERGAVVGYWGPRRWIAWRGCQENASNDGPRVGELCISGEHLRHGAEAVLGTLLHEAAHALAEARGEVAAVDPRMISVLPSRARSRPRADRTLVLYGVTF